MHQTLFHDHSDILRGIYIKALCTNIFDVMIPKTDQYCNVVSQFYIYILKLVENESQNNYQKSIQF